MHGKLCKSVTSFCSSWPQRAALHICILLHINNFITQEILHNPYFSCGKTQTYVLSDLFVVRLQIPVQVWAQGGAWGWVGVEQGEDGEQERRMKWQETWTYFDWVPTACPAPGTP